MEKKFKYCLIEFNSANNKNYGMYNYVENIRQYAIQFSVHKQINYLKYIAENFHDLCILASDF